MPTKTFEQAMIEMLQDCGLIENEPQAIIAQIKADPKYAMMTDLWNEDISDYSTKVLTSLVISVRTEAANWLAKNSPVHWARRMFEDNQATGLDPAP